MKFTFLLLSAGLACAEPVIVNDALLASSLQKGISAFAEKAEHPTADELSQSLNEPCLPVSTSAFASTSPSLPASAVYMIGSVYKCGKCDKWHLGGVATAWALSSDGVMVTNYHVFEKAKGPAMGVCDMQGNTFKITAVLASNKVDDVAIFQTDAKGLSPLSLGPTAEIGSDVHVISHPDSNFFTNTFGDVSRYYQRPGPKDQKPMIRMAITADYAKGSSGGPVLDDQNRVVGMVSSTRSIYYNSSRGSEEKGPLQMVIKDCVPVSAIRSLVEEKEKHPAPEEAAAP